MERGFGKSMWAVGLACLWLAVGTPAQAAGPGETPIGFFTNVAERLLQSQFNLSLTQIQVYPSNQYTPAVHRLLQVAANLYEASTNNSDPATGAPYPSVFRPLFASTGSNVFICGYTNDNDAGTARDWFANSPPGIPMVVGAKKSLPNFNEFVFQTAVQIARKLEVGRPATNAPPNQTNQMMILSISNVLGVETWNSYSRPFSNDFQIFVTNILSVTVSNATDGYATSPPPSRVGVDAQVGAATNQNWYFKPRFPNKILTDGGFMVPLYANAVTLPGSRYNGAGFDGVTNSFLPRTDELPVADWRLMISNRLFYVVSSPPGPQGKILDIISLLYQTNLNLTEFLVGQNGSFSESDPLSGISLASLWDTNRIGNPITPRTPTEGVWLQLGISQGTPNVDSTFWKIFNGENNDKTNSIAQFKAFLYPFTTSTNLFQQAPFTALRRFVHTVTWQANDPLVHYLLEDLKDYTNNATLRYLKRTDLSVFTNNLGRLNERYRPWNGNPLKDSNPIDSYVAIKDPGVFTSDDWDFPTNLLANPGLVGRVHRGTPWQTIYLKAEVADLATWIRQSPYPETHPTNDWNLAALFLALCNTNEPSALFSINQTSPSAWAGIMSGMIVLSNTTVTLPLPPAAPTNFDTWVIDPTSPQVQVIVDGINRTRSSRLPFYFRQVGDILSTPELTVASPWLDLSGDMQRRYGLTDEAHEKIPEQLLPLLRADPILSVRPVGGQFQARVTAFAGYWYALEASSDLQHWTALATRFAESAAFDFPDLIGTGTDDVFYRIRLVSAPLRACFKKG